MERSDLPRHETDSLDDRGLNNFLPGEDTPRHSVGTIRMRVGPQVATLVDDVVRDVRIPLDIWKELVQ